MDDWPKMPPQIPWEMRDVILETVLKPSVDHPNNWLEYIDKVYAAIRKYLADPESLKGWDVKEDIGDDIKFTFCQTIGSIQDTIEAALLNGGDRIVVEKRR